jgi:hypothetical protein
MGPAGKPRLDLGSFVGGIVIHDDMDIEPFWDLSIDLFEEVQELGRPVTLVSFADDEPRGNIKGGEQRGRTMPHVAVRATSGTPGIIRKTGCSRSSAWIWLFSSMLRTRARLGGKS